MKLENLHKPLRTLKLLEQLPKAGEGKITLRDISFWSGMKKQTCWRALNILLQLELVTKTVEPHRNSEIHYWNTTDKANELMMQKEFIQW